MKGKIISLQYIPGEYVITQGHKSYERARYKNGRYIKPTGFGYAAESKSSQLIAYISVKDGVVQTRVDFFFKNAWGRLTKKRIAAINAAIPESVSLSKETGYYGNEYFVIKEKDLEEWFLAAKQLKK